jgi:hypothetical protein
MTNKALSSLAHNPLIRHTKRLQYNLGRGASQDDIEHLLAHIPLLTCLQ